MFNLKSLAIALAFVSTSLTAIAQVQQSYQLETTQGWNLLGNSIQTSINVTTMFGDPNKVTSVWKWDNPGNRWMFYSPTLTTAELQSYTTANGFGILTTIEGGEGYWVNTKVANNFGTQSGLGVIAPKLGVGWNLIASGGTADSSTVSVEMFSHIVKKAVDVVSVWQWNVTAGKWNFYAPSLVMDGGLAAYQTANNMGAIAGSVSGSGKGFWVKGNGAVAVTPKVVYKTSYENQQSITLDKPTIPNLRDISNAKPETGEIDFNERIAFADFLQDGTFSAVAVTSIFKNLNIANNPGGYADSPAKLYILSKNSKGEWIDKTPLLIENSNRYTCINPSFLEVADLNNDGKPDVVIPCAGVDFATDSLSNSLAKQYVILSQPNGTYIVTTLLITGPKGGTMSIHQTAVADIDGDGNADIVYADPHSNLIPFVMWGNGDGTFRQDMTRFSPDLKDVGIFGVKAIPVNGKINLILSGTSKGSDPNYLWYGFGTRMYQFINGAFKQIAVLNVPVVQATGYTYGLGMDFIYSNGYYYGYHIDYNYINQAVIKYDIVNNTAKVIEILAQTPGHGGPSGNILLRNNTIVNIMGGCGPYSLNPSDFLYYPCAMKVTLN
jgi:hypothetical protein